MEKTIKNSKKRSVKGHKAGAHARLSENAIGSSPAADEKAEQSIGEILLEPKEKPHEKTKIETPYGRRKGYLNVLSYNVGAAISNCVELFKTK